MKSRFMLRSVGLGSLIVAGAALTGCGGGDTDFSGTPTSSSPAATQETISSTTSFDVGGTVNGLSSSTALGLALSNGSVATLTQSGTFTFDKGVLQGESYAVSVSQQPTGQTCTVSKGSGSSISATITDVAVDCVTHTYTLSGTVSGLSSDAVTLRTGSATNAVTVNQNGAFQLPQALPFGSDYAITVAQQPVGQTCTVAQGSGSNLAADVTDISISCAQNLYSLSGTVSGLASGAQVMLKNGTDTVAVSANGSFTFPTLMAVYDVSVASQPTGQTCTVSNGTGSASANVSTVAVNCVTNTYSISGTLSGLSSGTQITLKNNGADALTISANGSFTFPARATAYAVTIATQPSGSQFCTVSNGSGTAAANVSNITVTCAAADILNCGSTMLLNGMVGRVGFIVDQIQTRCAGLSGSGVDTATTVNGASAGGTGGVAFSAFTCPSGEWVTTVSGYNGTTNFPTAMASIQLTCSGGSKSPLIVLSNATGANVGLNAYSFTCSTGLRARGFAIGAVGGYTGFMKGLLCE